MAARDLSSVLATAALEGPTSREALDAAAQVAKVIGLGASVADLDPDAAQGIAFLFRRIHSEFTTPALATTSSAGLHELWAEVAGPVLRLMDAVAVFLYEATRTSQSAVMAQRLEHGDTAALAKLAAKLTDRAEPASCEKLRRTSLLINDARARLREVMDGDRELDPFLVKNFHTGVLIWALGISLCAKIADRVSSLVDEPLRPRLVTDAVEFASSGARFTATCVAIDAGLDISHREPPESLEPVLSNDEAVAFLLHATREIPRVFGPDVALRLELFRYPDEPDQSEFHLVIDSPLPPAQACERLDELGDGWWDAAAASLDVEIFAVLGVIDDE